MHKAIHQNSGSFLEWRGEAGKPGSAPARKFYAESWAFGGYAYRSSNSAECDNLGIGDHCPVRSPFIRELANSKAATVTDQNHDSNFLSGSPFRL
jgi:hypothetical protein